MKKIAMKDKWEDITINDFDKLNKIADGDYESDIERQVAMISVLTDLSEETIYDLPIDVYRELSSKLSFLSTPIPEVEVKPFVKMQKMDLEMAMIPSNMSVAQFVDFQEYQKVGDLAGMLTTILIPKHKHYGEGYDIVKLKGRMGNMKLVDARAYSTFFLKLYKGLLEAMKDYLVKRVQKMTRKEKSPEIKRKLEVLLLRSGVGLN